MRVKSSFLSAVYALGQLSLGLLLHPYQTMQSLVEDKVFWWMTLLPSASLAVVTIVWRFGVVPSVRLLFSCQSVPLGVCGVLPFVSNWLTFFCAYWQVLLLYLFVRFAKAYK